MTSSQFPYQKKTLLVASLVLAWLAGNCSAQETPEQDKAPDKHPVLKVAPNQPTAVPITKTSKPVPISEMKKMTKEQQILFAREDLAKRLDLELDEVSLSGATPVIWRSGALGCPQEGMEYTQALVKGVLIMLRVEHTAYRYHAIPAGEPFYCPDSQAEPPYINSSDA